MKKPNEIEHTLGGERNQVERERELLLPYSILNTWITLEFGIVMK